jgi:hypothetical protein
MVCCRRACVAYYVLYLFLGTVASVIVMALFGSCLSPLLTAPPAPIPDGIVTVAVETGLLADGTQGYVVVRTIYQTGYLPNVRVVLTTVDRNQAMVEADRQLQTPAYSPSPADAFLPLWLSISLGVLVPTVYAGLWFLLRWIVRNRCASHEDDAYCCVTRHK